MKRKILSIIAVIAMLIAMMPTNAFADVGESDAAVSVIDETPDITETSESSILTDDVGEESADNDSSLEETENEQTAIATWTGSGNTYETLQEAVDAAAEAGEGTVVLNADSTEDVIIPAGAKITITISEGVTLTGKSSHTILNNGVLVVNGNGQVVNNVKGSAAIANAPGADAKLNGCTFSGNTWYVVKNLGAMEINGAKIIQNDEGSSAIDNGFYGSKGNDFGYSESDYTDGSVSLTIEDGYVYGGMNTIKNDDLAKLTINGGSFTNDVKGSAVLMNWNDAEVNGGTFIQNAADGCVVTNGGLLTEADKGKLKITSGSFENTENGRLFGLNGGAGKDGTLDISGGSFTGITDSTDIVNETSGYEINISGGTFSSSIPSIYAADGFEPKQNADGSYGVEVETAKVAEYNGNKYETLQEAVDAAAEAGEGTVVLNADSTEDVIIPAGAKITITISEGVTLTGKSSHTILNNGVLVVNGNGQVVNNVKGSAAIANAPGADAKLNGCTFSGNTWYVVKNLGAMEINGAKIIQNDEGSSAIDNGFYGSKGNDFGYSESDYTDGSVSLTIEDGYVYGGMNTIKNDDLAKLTINGGSFTNDVKGSAVLMNWNDAEVNGGTFIQNAADGCVVTNGGLLTEADKGKLKITSGSFENTENGRLFGLNGGAGKDGTLDISGGSFTGITDSTDIVNETSGYEINISGGTFSSSIPSIYAADGFEPKQNADGSYGVCNHPTTEIRNAKEASCTENGYTGDTYCTECGAKVKAGETIPASGHSYATEYSTDGTSHWYECTVCHDKKEVAEHSFETIVDKEATCAEDGMQHEKCTVCGYEKAGETIPASGHSYATEYSTDGTSHWYECTVCHDKKEVAEHSFETIVDKEAICTETGTHHKVCTVCGYTAEAEEIPAAGHTYTEWSVSCSSDGIFKTRKCTVCSDVDSVKVETTPGINIIEGIPYVCNENNIPYSTGTPVINGEKYFVQNYIAKSGWLRLADWQMYFDPETYEAATGLSKIDGKAYLFDENGVEILKSRTEVINGKKYWFQPDGSLMSGWCDLGVWRMYFDPETYEAAIGVKTIGEASYLFDENGVLYKGNGTPVFNGKKYFVQDSKLMSGWLKLADWQMYFNPETYEAATGLSKIDGKAYLFDENGVEILKSRTEVINGKKYWFQPDGSLMSGWCDLGVWRMYFDPDTYAAAIGRVFIDGTYYQFDSNGVLIGD